MDNINPGDLDLNIDSYFQVCLNESDDEVTETVQPTPVSTVSAPAATGVADFYNHKKHNKFFTYQEPINEGINPFEIDNIANSLNNKFKDFDLEDNTELINHRQNRRQLAERLESDPEFRAKYILEEDKKRLNILIDEKDKKEKRESESGKEEPVSPKKTTVPKKEKRVTLNEDHLFKTVHELPDDDDFVLPKKLSEMKNVYIHHVEHLHIHIHNH